MEPVNEFERFGGIVSKPKEDNDIAKMGDRLAEDFTKKVNDIVDQLDQETNTLKEEKAKAETVYNDIHKTVKRLWDAHKVLVNTKDRIDTMIDSTEKIKAQLKGESKPEGEHIPLQK